MEEGFPFSSPKTNFPINSYMTSPQLTFLTLDKAPKMVLLTVIVIQFGFSGYKIGTTKGIAIVQVWSREWGARSRDFLF